MTNYVGIDPGKQGALVGVSGKGEILSTVRTPMVGKEYDILAMRSALINCGECVARIEHAQAFPRIGAGVNFEVGRGYGMWLTLLTVMRIPFEIVRANVWHTKMCAGIPKSKKPSKGESKKRAKLAAMRIWPGTDRLGHDGLIDAALIAEYCRREMH